MDITFYTLFFLIGALGIALGFECINGFHDTANAVATVIYTKSLKPEVAVLWSGFCNFLGVLLGGIAVAFSIVHLLPVDLLVKIDTGAGMAMVISLLLAAIIWNFGTWFMGIPSSSSHTLIGAIIGVGLANSYLIGHFGSGINWKKAGEVGMSLLISPLIGFGLAYTLLLILKRFAPSPAMHEPPHGDTPPPGWIRALLILTCTGVSFAHGSNDGQKGIGLIMLILIGLVPMHYAMNMAHGTAEFKQVVEATDRIQDTLLDPQMERAMIAYQRSTRPASSRPFESTALAVIQSEDSVIDAPPQAMLADPDLHTTQELAESVRGQLQGKSSPADLKPDERWKFRTKALMLDHSLTKLNSKIMPVLSQEKREMLSQSRSTLRGSFEYAPTWVLVAVAVALGAGTTVGWKRIVVTVGEKIGKTHLTYSQGASAELVAMTTIGMADILGMPVSTTHVLSSGVAGSMAANKSGLQMSTIKSIAIAWILTLPVSLVLAGGLFLFFRLFV